MEGCSADLYPGPARTPVPQEPRRTRGHFKNAVVRMALRTCVLRGQIAVELFVRGVGFFIGTISSGQLLESYCCICFALSVYLF